MSFDKLVWHHTTVALPVEGLIGYFFVATDMINKIKLVSGTKSSLLIKGNTVEPG